MPISDQPVFEAGDIPTATQLNSWMTQIAEAFNSGGSTGLETADFRWPMKAGGHINMGGNAINGVPTFGSRYNLTNRPPWASAQMVLDEVEARGGATVVLMGNTTQASQTDKTGLPGIKPGHNTHIMGHGHSSILGSVYSKEKDDLFFNDLQMNGANQLINCRRVTFLRVTFTGTGDYQLNLQGCSDVTFVDCRFTGAATVQLKAEGFKNLHVSACEFVDCGNYYAQFYLADGSSFEDLVFQYNILRHPSAYTPGDSVAFFIGDQSFSWNEALQGWNLSVRGNLIGAGGPGGMYAAGIKNLNMSYNMQLDATNAPKGLWIKEGRDITLYGNLIKSGDYGMMLGDTNRYVGGYVCIDYNYVVAADEAMVWRGRQFYSPGPRIVTADLLEWTNFIGNYMESADATLPAAAIWRLNQNPTRMYLAAQMFGNIFNPTGGGEGFRTFTTDSAVTTGADIGTATDLNQWFLFVGNNSLDTNNTTTDITNNITTNRVVYLNNNI